MLRLCGWHIVDPVECRRLAGEANGMLEGVTQGHGIVSFGGLVRNVPEPGEVVRAERYIRLYA